LWGLWVTDIDPSAIFLGSRLILFAIGLSSVLAFFALTQRIFGQHLISFLAGLIFILSPITAKFFFFIHPESTGILFIFLGVHALLDFRDSPKNKLIYGAGVFSLILASLSKQIYFLLSIPILVMFFWLFSAASNVGFLKRMCSKVMIKTLVLTGFGALIIFFIIHPSAFIQFPFFIEYQTTLSGFVSGENAYSLADALQAWGDHLVKKPGTVILIFLLVPTMIAGLLAYHAKRRVESLFLTVNAVTGLIILTLILTMNRLFMMLSYLQPIYPLLILNFLAVMVWSQKTSWRFGWLVHLVCVYFAIILVSSSALDTLTILKQRLDYKSSAAFVTYDYLIRNLKPEEKVAHDHFVAIPRAFTANACHYWQGCGTDAIEAFNPDVVMFNPDFHISDKPYAETERLKRYVREKGMELEKVFKIPQVNEEGIRLELTIHVYRLPRLKTG
jgi:hypothetical protein